MIHNEKKFAWPSGKGSVRDQSIIPLYPSVVDAVKINPLLHELMALVDIMRVGRAREREIAIQALKKKN